jgi:hypothetical protein
MCRFADPKDCRYFFMCLRTGHPRRAGCGQGQVENRFYGVLAADMAGTRRETSPFYSELAASRDR